jgi:4,4'-diaponeurosporenoate glycosyltransferase
LQSLMGQISGRDEIIVVDDHSTDATKVTGEKFGAKVLSIKPAPEGWIGKTWPSYQGALIAKCNTLVILDADITVEKNGLSKMLSTFQKDNAVISVQPYHKMVHLYEQLSAFFNIVLMAAMGPFTILGNSLKPLGLFGPVLIINKDSYLNHGPHEKVKGQILENMALGAELLKRGFKIHCLGGLGSISFRMYPNGLKDLINGWSKGFAAGSVKTSIPLLIMIIGWISGCIGTCNRLFESVLTSNNIQIALWCVLYFLYTNQIYWMLRRIGNFRYYTALFYPLPLLFFILIFIYSFVRIFITKNVQWKGRKINLSNGMKG